MRKNVLAIACILVANLTGCGVEQTTVSVTVQSNTELHNTTLGTDSLISIGNGL